MHTQTWHPACRTLALALALTLQNLGNASTFAVFGGQMSRMHTWRHAALLRVRVRVRVRALVRVRVRVRVRVTVRVRVRVSRMHTWSHAAPRSP
jgi:hypothetical protein